MSLSGFDVLSLSFTDKISDTETMKNKFGEVLIRIKVVPFLKIISRKLGILPTVQSVQYADLKIFRDADCGRFIYKLPFSINPSFARAIRRASRLPSVFAKPMRFESESEVRIAFLLDRDAPLTKSVVMPEALRYVERID